MRAAFELPVAARNIVQNKKAPNTATARPSTRGIVGRTSDTDAQRTMAINGA